MLPDWLSSTLVAMLPLCVVYFGIGIPAALHMLPRQDWHDKPLVLMCAIGFGATIVTIYMFLVGTFSQNTNITAGDPLNPMHTQISALVGGSNQLRLPNLMSWCISIAVVFWVMAYIGIRKSPKPDRPPRIPLASDERFLIALIIIATVLRWIVGSWTTFGWYDELWVYGYQGRIYTLLGFIPTDIGYYPQFLQLQYAFAQIVTGGINDHAARAVLPFLQVGSILAAYVLGSRLINRRVGIILAAIWALYPHFGFWTRIGDLEIPQTFAFTASAAFFLMAWTQSDKTLQRRYAVLAGIWLGILMWIKPTGGALIWGVVLAVMVEFIRVRGDWRIFAPRFRVAFWMAMACILIGAMWYIRNLLYGHAVITFPPSYWLDEAGRSASEFGWLFLALGVLLMYLFLAPLRHRPARLPITIGLVLIVLGAYPTIASSSRMQGLEWIAFVLGIAIIGLTLADFAFAYLSEAGWKRLSLIGWAGVLALPYFITYFYSYSYHYRLSFPIVPLLILPTAVILGLWIIPERIKAWRFPVRFGYVLAIFGVSLQGILIPLYDEGYGWDWWWTMPAKDDLSDASLMELVNYLDTYQEADAPPNILAPGLQRLPFFFPLWDIDITTIPRDLANADGVDYFIDGVEAQFIYGATGGFHNPFYASLRRENFTQPSLRFEDWREHFDLYRLIPQSRFTMPPPQPDLTIETTPDSDIRFGDMVRLVRYGVVNPPIFTGIYTTPVEFKLIWEVLTPTEHDYSILYHLYRADAPDEVLANADGVVNKPYGWELNYYSTLFWERGEFVIDRRGFFIPQLPNGDVYRVRVGFYRLDTWERLPLYIDDVLVGDTFTLDIEFSINQPE